jgi:hypothetical protein
LAESRRWGTCMGRGKAWVLHGDRQGESRDLHTLLRATHLSEVGQLSLAPGPHSFCKAWAASVYCKRQLVLFVLTPCGT